MKRVVGFALCFVAAGIMIGMCLPTDFVKVMISVICIVVGYQLFCK